MSDVRVWVPVASITSTGFTLHQSGAGSVLVNWRAIGSG
jgi:hypothetical protein